MRRRSASTPAALAAALCLAADRKCRGGRLRRDGRGEPSGGRRVRVHGCLRRPSPGPHDAGRRAARGVLRLQRLGTGRRRSGRRWGPGPGVGQPGRPQRDLLEPGRAALSQAGVAGRQHPVRGRGRRRRRRPAGPVVHPPPAAAHAVAEPGRRGGAALRGGAGVRRTDDPLRRLLGRPRPGRRPGHGGGQLRHRDPGPVHGTAPATGGLRRAVRSGAGCARTTRSPAG